MNVASGVLVVLGIANVILWGAVFLKKKTQDIPQKRPVVQEAIQEDIGGDATIAQTIQSQDEEPASAENDIDILLDSF